MAYSTQAGLKPEQKRSMHRAGRKTAIYHDGERLYSEHRAAAEAELLPCSSACSRAILLYSGS